MEELTLEQALQNVSAAVEQFKGTKGDHIVLEKSILMITKAMQPKEKEIKIKSK